jgi:DinB superfamily
MGQQAHQLAQSCAYPQGYMDRLLKDVTPAMFARQPHVNGKHIQCNHPAWVYGHLAIYTQNCMESLKMPVGITARPAGFEDLFKDGVDCKDDAAGTIYPAMDVVVGHFKKSHAAVIAALPDASDELFNLPNMRDGKVSPNFPTMGSMLTFLLLGHTMVHAGQVSTWRRCMGLGPA